jgi:hypothetical protein
VQRLSRSRVISDIEFIINSPGPAVGKRKWTSKGAECSADRHSFVGAVYSFHVDILQVHLHATGSPKWKLLIVNEALALEDSGARSSTVRTSAIQWERAMRPWAGRHCIADLVASHPPQAVRIMAAESLRELSSWQRREKLIHD